MGINRYKKYSFFIGLIIIAILIITTIYYLISQNTLKPASYQLESSYDTLSNTAFEHTSEQIRMTSEDELVNEYLKIEYDEGFLYYTRTIQNGKYLLRFDPESSNPALYTNEQHTLYIFTSPTQTLYSINPITLKVNLLSENNVYLPSLHQTYSFIAYTSDRREKGIYDIWLHDLATNTEAVLIEQAYFINWHEGELIFKDIVAQKIVSYNLSTKRMLDLFSEVDLYKSLSDDWIVYTHQNDNHLYFYNLKTRLLQQLEAATDMNLKMPSQISSNSQFVFGNGYENNIKADSLFYFVFDLTNGELQTFDNINSYTQCEANINDIAVDDVSSIHKACAIE